MKYNRDKIYTLECTTDYIMADGERSFIEGNQYIFEWDGSFSDTPWVTTDEDIYYSMHYMSATDMDYFFKLISEE